MAEKAYLAVDIGASSGRHVLGLFAGGQLRLEEVYRFENGGIEAADRLQWDLLGQWSHIRQGLRAAAAKRGDGVASIGVDTWALTSACSAAATNCSAIPTPIATAAPMA